VDQSSAKCPDGLSPQRHAGRSAGEHLPGCLAASAIKPLDQLQAGEMGRIVKVDYVGAVTRRIVDMGMVKGSVVEVVKTAPLGDPIEVKVKGCNISLRRSEAATVLVADTGPGKCRRRRFRGGCNTQETESLR